MAIELLNLGAQPDDDTGDSARDGGAKINRNFQGHESRISALSSLNMIAGPVTKLPAGSNPTASLTGTAPNYTLNLGLPEGPAGAGAPTSADILAIAEKDRLERALAAAGVPDEPSLILDFVRGVHFASKSAITASIMTMVAALGGVSTFARASTATYFDSDGLLKTASAGVPRIEYDPVTRACRGLLIENQARTNLCLRSQELDNAAWTKVRASIVADTITAPDGTTTADKIVEDASATTTHFAQCATATITSGSTVTGSVFVKAAERTFAQISILNPASAFEAIRVPINLSTGQLGTVFMDNGATAGVATVVPIGNDWYRVSVTGVLGASTSARLTVFLATDTTAGGNTYTGNGSSGIYAWGSQFEAGASPSSYIPTGASTVTRASDSLALAGASWISSAALTCLVEARLNETRGSGAASNLAFFSNSAGTNTVNVREGTVIAGADLTVSSGGVSSVDSGSYATPTATTMRFAVGYDASSWGFAKDNALTFTGGATTPPVTMDRVFIGYNGFMGHIRRIMFWPQRLTNTKVQALSNQAAWS